MSVFSQRLKQAMQQANMTQKQLADETGLGKSSISQYLSGKNEPSKYNMAIIAAKLGVPLNWLNGTSDALDTDGKHRVNLPVETAAKLMGVGKQMLRQGLKNGDFPFGYAVKMPSGKYRYYISPSKFSDFTGCEV